MAKTKTSTKSKAKASKKTIDYKQAGATMILIIDGQKFTKYIKIKTKRENLKSLVDAYNKRNSLKKEKEILDIMLEGKESTDKKAKVKAEAKKKSTPKAKPTASASKKAKEEAIKAATALLKENDYVVTKKREKGYTGRNREH